MKLSFHCKPDATVVARKLKPEIEQSSRSFKTKIRDNIALAEGRHKEWISLDITLKVSGGLYGLSKGNNKRSKHSNINIYIR
jgi:hypothetical protein